MNPESIKESIQAVVDGITPLAQKLQVPIENLWAWALRMNYANAVFNLLVVFFCFGVLYGYYRFMKYGMGKDEGESDTRIYRHNWAPIAVAGGMMSFVAIVVLFFSLYEASMRFIAPEWSTMKDIISLIK